MNIFFVRKGEKDSKEIICFDVSKESVWNSLQEFGF